MTRHRLCAAVVCAVLALPVTGCSDAAEPDAAPSPPPSSAEREASPDATPPFGYTAWLDGLPVGRPPAVGYVIGHTYHSATGRTVPLPADRGVTAIARLGDGFLVVDDRFFEGTAGIVTVDARGHRVSEIGSVAAAPVLSRDGSTLRWITFTPHGVSPEEREPTRLHVADIASGEVRSRIIRRDVDALPRVPAPPGRRVRLPMPVPVRGRLSARAWEDRTHLLVGIVRPRAGTAAVVRLDTRSRTWSLAVDWTSLEDTSQVVFETTR